MIRRWSCAGLSPNQVGLKQPDGSGSDNVRVPRRMPSQLQLPIPPKWGGARAGAGRPPERERSGPTHSRRPDHDPRHPLSRHVARGVRRSVAAISTHVRGVAASHRRGEPGGVSNHSFLRSARSPSPDRRSGFGAGPATGHAEPHDPVRPRHQPNGPPARRRLGPPLPRARAAHAHRGEAGDGLRAPQLPQAPPRRARRRPAQLGDLVRRVAPTTAEILGAAPRGHPHDVARVCRLATRGRAARRPRVTARRPQRASVPPSTPASGGGGSHQAWLSRLLRRAAAAGVSRRSTSERT